MSFSERHSIFIESDPEESIGVGDDIEITGITSCPPFFRNGDHARVIEVNPDGFKIQLVTPRRSSPFKDSQHWIPRKNARKFTPFGPNLPYKDN